jgi:hypothetical protein
MGYFSNGTEGEGFEEVVCRRCTHFKEPEDGTCPVWTAHLLFNNDQHENAVVEQILSLLIPLTGQWYECAMFVERAA